MSSHKIAVRPGSVESIEDDREAAWVAVTSPLQDEPVGDVSAVVTAISVLRGRYATAIEESVTIEPVPAFGCEDVGLADAVSEDMAERWDD